MIKCPHCAAELEDDAHFCSYCGSAIRNEGSQSAEGAAGEQTASAGQTSYSQPLYSQQTSNQSYNQSSYNQNGRANGQAEPQKINGFAIAGFVTSFFVAILGIIFSAIALKQIDEKNEGGKGLAVAGLVLGIVWLAIQLLLGLTGACTLSSLFYFL